MHSPLSLTEVNRTGNSKHSIVKARAEFFLSMDLLCDAVNILRAKLSGPNRLINERLYQHKAYPLSSCFLECFHIPLIFSLIFPKAGTTTYCHGICVFREKPLR